MIQVREFIIACVLIVIVCLTFLVTLEIISTDPPALPKCPKGDVLVIEREDDGDGARDYSCVTPKEYP